MLASPLTEFIRIFQDLFWAATIPSWRLSLAFGAWTMLSLGVGLWLFQRRSARLIERL